MATRRIEEQQIHKARARWPSPRPHRLWRLRPGHGSRTGLQPPLPIDAKIIAAARGLQASGIVLCVANRTEITRCQCFIELALSETKERVGGILMAATTDWTRLQAYPS